MSNRFWSNLFKHARSSWKRRRRRANRLSGKPLQPNFERLEDRQMMTTVNWVNAAGGAWNVGTNWSTGNVPVVADDVVIDVPSASVTITHDPAACPTAGLLFAAQVSQMRRGDLRSDRCAGSGDPRTTE